MLSHSTPVVLRREMFCLRRFQPPASKKKGIVSDHAHARCYIPKHVVVASRVCPCGGALMSLPDNFATCCCYCGGGALMSLPIIGVIVVELSGARPAFLFRHGCGGALMSLPCILFKPKKIC